MFCYGAYAVPLTVEGNQLVRPDQEKCSADGGREKKGKKKKAKKTRNQFGEVIADDEDDGPSYKIH